MLLLAFFACTVITSEAHAINRLLAILEATGSTGTGGTNNVTLTPPSGAQLDKTYHFCSFQGNVGNTEHDITFRATALSSTSNLVIYAGQSGGGNNALTYGCYIVYFSSDSDLTVSRYNSTTNATTKNITISAVSATSRTFVIPHGETNAVDTDIGREEFWRYRLTSTTNVEVTLRNAADESNAVYFEVVDWGNDEIRVQHIDGTAIANADASQTATIPTAVNTGRTWLIATWRMGSNITPEQTGRASFAVTLTNSTTVTATRGVTGTNYLWSVQVIEDISSVGVWDTATTSIALGVAGNTGSAAYSRSFDTSRSYHIGTGWGNYAWSGSSNDNTTDNVDTAISTVRLSTATTVSVARGVNDGFTLSVPVQGIDFRTDILSGRVYTDEGLTSIGSNKTVSVSINGGAATSIDTDNNGYYTFRDLAVSPGDVITLYLDGETEKAALVTVMDATADDLNLYQNRLILRHDNSGSITNNNLATADNNGDTDITSIYSVSGSNVTVADGYEIFIPSGHTYAPGGNVTGDDIDINGTFTIAGNDVTISGTWDAQGGSFSASTGSVVTFDSSGSELIYSNGNAFHGIRFEGTTGTFTLEDALNVNDDMDLYLGTVDVKTGENNQINVAGDWTMFGVTFVARSGKVVLDGTNHSISGDTTFYQLEFIETTNDSINSNITFAAGSQTNVTSTWNFEGLDANDKLVLRSSSTTGTQWKISPTGLRTISWLDVKDSNNNSGSTVNCTSNCTDSTNNTDWNFTALPITVSGRVYTDEGVTPIGANNTVGISINGTALDASDETDATGNFSITTNSVVPAGSVITVYLENETDDAILVTVSNGTNISGINLYKDFMVIHNHYSGTTTTTNLNTADNNGDADITAFYSIAGSNLTSTNGKTLYVASGATFAPNGNISVGSSGTSSTFNIQGNLTASAGQTLTVYGDLKSYGNFSGYNTAMTVEKNITIGSGTFTSTSNTLTWKGSDFDIPGGTFSANSGTVLMQGTATQTASLNSNTFNNIVTTTTAGSGVVFDQAFSTANLTCTTYNGRLTFQHGTTFNISNTLTLTGASTANIRLDSVNSSSRFTLNVTGGEQNVSYVNVSNSEAAGNNIVATNSTNGSNNDSSETSPKWIFSSPSNFQITVGQFTLNAGAGNQSITGVGFQPKGYVLLLTKNNANDLPSAGGTGLGGQLTVGMTDGTRQFCISSGSEDDQADTDVVRRGMTDKVLCNIDVGDADPAIRGEAGHVSMDADGFTINNTTAFSEPANVKAQYIAFGGNDVSVYVNTVTLAGVIGNSVDVNTVGFEPDLVLAGFIGYLVDAALDANNDDMSFSLGWAVNPSIQAANNQYSLMTAEQDAVAAGNPITRFDNTYVATSYRDDAIDASGEINTFDGSGFSITTRLAAGAASESVGYMAIDLGTTPKVYSTTHTLSTTNDVAYFANAGFEPIFLMGLGTAEITAFNTNTQRGSFSVGIADQSKNYSMSYVNQDIADPTNSGNYITASDFLQGYRDTASVEWGIDISSFDNSGWTLNIYDKPGSAYLTSFLAIGTNTALDTISGKAYIDEGTTTVPAGTTIAIAKNGSSVLQSTTTDASGNFAFTLSTYDSDVITIWIDGSTGDGVTVTESNGAFIANADIYRNHLIVRNEDAADALTNLDLAVADNVGDTDITDVYSVSTDGTLLMVSTNKLYIPSTRTFSPGDAIDADDVEVNGTLQLGTNNATITGTLDVAGTLNSTATITLDSTQAETLRTGSGSLTNMTFNGVGGSWELQNALDLSGNLTITNGTLDVKSGNNYSINLEGTWSNSGTFTPRNGTVTFDGVYQGIVGSTSFYNFTKTDLLNNSSSDTLNFSNAGTTTISNTMTINGIDSNDQVRIVSDTSGSQWGLSPAGSRSISYLYVQDSYNSSGSTIYCTNGCTNGGNNFNWDFSSLPLTFTGRAYSDQGTTPLGAGIRVALSINGASIDATADTDINGNYSLTSNSNIGDGAVLTFYFDNETEKSVLVSISDGTNKSNVDLYQNFLTLTHDATGPLTSTEMLVADNNGDADITAAYSFAGVNMTAKDGFTMLVKSGSTFVPSGTLTTDSLDIEGSLTMGSNTLTVSGNFDASSGGTFTTSSTITFDANSSKNLNQGSNSFGNVTFNGVGGSWILQNNMDINGNLTLTQGTLDANTTGNYSINLSGNWNKNSAFTFTPRQGTVVLDGGDQTLTGSTTFYNFTKNDTVNDSTSYTATFDNTATFTVQNNFVMNGLDANDLIYLRSNSPTNQWDLTPQGSRSVSFLDVRDSNNTSSTSILCTNGCIDSTNNVRWIFVGSPVTLSGTVYADEGVTPVGAGINVAVSISGASIDATDDTNGSGVFSITTFSSVDNGDVLALFLDNAAQDAVLVTLADGTNKSNLNLYQNYLILRTESGAGLTNTNINEANNSGDTDIDAIYTMSGNEVIPNFGIETFIPGGHTVTPDGTLNLHNLDVNGTLTLTTQPLFVAGSFDATGGSVTSTGTITFDATGPKNITSGTISFNNITFNGTGGSWILQDPLDVNGNLTITNGTLDVNAAGNHQINLYGNWSNSGTFTARNGTVLLDGIDQSLSGSTTFYNLSKTETTNNSADSILSLDSAGTQIISNTWICNGLDTNDRINIRSTVDGNDAFINPQSTRTISWLDVKDSNNVNATDISCTNNCINSTGNTKWIFNSQPIVISGTVYSDEGTTNIGAGQTVALSIDGSIMDSSSVTNASGQYTINTVAGVGATSILTLYLDGMAADAVTVTVGNGTYLSGIDLYQNRLIVRNENGGGFLTNANLATADDNGDSDISALYTISGSTLTLQFDKELFIPTGHTFQPGNPVDTHHIDINGTLSLAANNLFISGNFDATTASTFTSTGTVTFDGTGSQTILSSGKSFNNITLNAAGTWTLEDTLDVNGNLTITTGTLDVKSGVNNQINLYGNWSNSGTFTARNGTVVLDGIDQSISGNTTFYNLTKTETTNNSVDSVLTFAADGTQVISNTWTCSGLDTNDMINIRSSVNGSGAEINPQGTRAISWLDVKDSNNVNATTVSCLSNCTDSTGNTNWNFTGNLITITGTVYSDEGITNIGAGQTVSVSINGGAIDSSDDTDASGVYSITTLNPVLSGAILTLYLNDEVADAVTVTIAEGTDISGLNLYQNYLIVRTEIGTALTNSNLATADNNGDTDITSIYTMTGSQLNMVGTKELLVWAGDTFSPGNVVDAYTVDIDGTMSLAANNLYVSGHFDATTNANFSSSGTVTFDGTGPFNITSAGKSFNNISFTGAGGNWTLLDALDVNGNLSISASSTLDVNNAASFAITISGDWTNSGGFLARNGTVTLDGVNQTIGGNNTFYNLTKTETTNNATDSTLTFYFGGTQIISNTWTCTGLDADDMINIRSTTNGSQAQINPQGTRSISWLDVKDSNNINATIISCSNNCIDSTNNTNWDFAATSGVKFIFID